MAAHHYTMTGKIRPLLFFWIGRDAVGGARFTWRRGEGQSVGFELLIGSNPRRAPRGINRWGFLMEEVRATEAHTLGVMTESDEESLAEAEARIALEGQAGAHVFKAIQAAATAEEACAFVTTIHLARDLTYHDVATLVDVLDLAPRYPDAVRRIAVPPDTRPGFLVALAELIHRSVEGHRGPASDARAPRNPIAFAYNAKLYDLALRKAEFLPEVRLRARIHADVIRGDFESRNRASNSKTRFQIVYGTEGPLKEVPVHIAYEPRWWLRVELFLDGGADF